MPAFARDNTFSLTINSCAHKAQVMALNGDEALILQLITGEMAA